MTGERLQNARRLIIKLNLELDYFRLIHHIVILIGYILNCSIDKVSADDEKPAFFT